MVDTHWLLIEHRPVTTVVALFLSQIEYKLILKYAGGSPNITSPSITKPVPSHVKQWEHWMASRAVLVRQFMRYFKRSYLRLDHSCYHVIWCETAIMGDGCVGCALHKQPTETTRSLQQCLQSLYNLSSPVLFAQFLNESWGNYHSYCNYY